MSPSPIVPISAPFCGWVAVRSATESVAMLSLNRLPNAQTWSSDWPASAAAPTTLIRGMHPPRPRLSSIGASTPCAISSWTTISFTRMPAFWAMRSALFALMRSPLWFSVTSRMPAGRWNSSIASKSFGAPGAAKMSPTTLASSMPSPTNPESAGSWPEPPRVMTATLHGHLGWARTMMRSFTSFTLSL